ncbi:PcfK-like family protein [Aestuariibaculum marinum]|uniref:PcfK-like family protein n=1 Tax=Aestuariibaculum marinum TaxID=2683592 RepID=A0A8J6PYJ0_9FLAO|nr:PcfK-like family protein [Aestuariibaculum marinum]MBD0822617.1 PcfK-like family protein [Aestuariibaculum marinum]
MKATKQFKTIIQNYLNEVAGNDALFAETLKKENKNIDDCVTYILNEVQKSGCSGFADEEIFSMAIHYYDEDDLKPGKPVKCNVVVNHASEAPQKKAITKPKSKKKAVVKSDPVPNQQTSIFDFI